MLSRPTLPLAPGVYRCPRCRREVELFVRASSLRCEACRREMLSVDPLPLAFARAAFKRLAS
ncbi:MAG TPA: hypothetical protein VNT60_09365 [Deinococcales bacterium]|nr:hypothetical protein [Deinococcales bacterium]